VRQGGHAIGEADLGIRERVPHRGEDVLHRALEVGEERRGHLVGSRRDMNPGIDVDVHPGRILLMLEAVHRNERDPASIHGHLDRLVAGRPAEERPGRSRLHPNAEGVLAIGREDVLGRDPASGTEGRALDPLPLRGEPWHGVGRFLRNRRRITHREPGDTRGCVEVRIHQRRAEELSVGDVVEVVALRIRREVALRIDLERQEIPDRVPVLCLVQPLERPNPRVRVGDRERIELLLEGGGESLEDLLGGSSAPGRRHHACTKLSDDRLRDLPLLERPFGIVLGEREVPAHPPIVVAPHARLGDHVVRELVADRRHVDERDVTETASSIDRRVHPRVGERRDVHQCSSDVRRDNRGRDAFGGAVLGLGRASGRDQTADDGDGCGNSDRCSHSYLVYTVSTKADDLTRLLDTAQCQGVGAPRVRACACARDDSSLKSTGGAPRDARNSDRVRRSPLPERAHDDRRIVP